MIGQFRSVGRSVGRSIQFVYDGDIVKRSTIFLTPPPKGKLIHRMLRAEGEGGPPVVG